MASKKPISEVYPFSPIKHQLPASQPSNVKDRLLTVIHLSKSSLTVPAMTNLRTKPLANVEVLVHFVIHRVCIPDRAASYGPRRKPVRSGRYSICQVRVSCPLTD